MAVWQHHIMLHLRHAADSQLLLPLPTYLSLPITVCLSLAVPLPDMIFFTGSTTFRSVVVVIVCCLDFAFAFCFGQMQQRPKST